MHMMTCQILMLGQNTRGVTLASAATRLPPRGCSSTRKTEARWIARRAKTFVALDDELYKQSPSGGTHEVHPHQPGEAAPPRGPCQDLRTSRGPKVAGRKSLLPRFLLAHRATRCRGGRPQVRRMPVLCLANPFAGARAPNHPNHLPIHGLGPRHGGTPQKGPRWFHSPTRSSR